MRRTEAISGVKNGSREGGEDGFEDERVDKEKETAFSAMSDKRHSVELT
jgi:hypothetical protein